MAALTGPPPPPAAWTSTIAAAAVAAAGCRLWWWWKSLLLLVMMTCHLMQELAEPIRHFLAVYRQLKACHEDVATGNLSFLQTADRTLPENPNPRDRSVMWPAVFEQQPLPGIGQPGFESVGPPSTPADKQDEEL